MNLTRRFLDELTTAQLVERLDLALEGANLGIWDWDLRDNSVQFDRRWCEMLGLDHETTPMVLDTWSTLVHPDDIDACYRDIRAHLDGVSARYQNVHRMRHADGRWIYILDRGRISGRDEHGRAIRFTGTHLDVTALEVAEQRARMEERARLQVLTNFSATLAHELNTPLQVIGLAAHELARVVPSTGRDGDVAREALQAIEVMSQRAGRITSALRTLSGKGGLAECRLSDCFMQAADLFRERMEGDGIQLTLADQSGGGAVRATSGDVLRTLVILLDASLRALLAGSTGERRVDLSARVEAGQVLVTCSDSGVPWPLGQEVAGAERMSLGPSELLGPIVAPYGGRIDVVGGEARNSFVVHVPLAETAT